MRIGVLLIALCLSVGFVYAQDSTSKSYIFVRQAERLRLQKIDSLTELNTAAGNVFCEQGRTKFYCDSVVINRYTNELQAFGKVHINDADSVHIYGDYLQYFGKTKQAVVNGNVKLSDGKGTLYTQNLTYDAVNKTGVYKNGGRLVNKGTVLTSDEGVYNGELRDVLFRKNVRLKDPSYNLSADSLLYNTYTDIATFITKTTIKNADQVVITQSGYYDLKNKKSYFAQRPIIKDGSTTLIADETASDEATGFAEARGTVILKDTAEGTVIYAGNIKTNKKEKTFLATQNPVAALKQETDSLFIAADTLFSGLLSNLVGYKPVTDITSDTLAFISKAMALADSNRNRYLEAYYHVKIYSDSLQAVCDSMFYTTYDSAFRLLTQPLAWAQGNQVKGDTMYVFTKNKQPLSLKVFENALAINKAQAGFLNQIKGRTINGTFKDGVIHFLRAKGAAESVYYPEDENKKLIGVNKLSSDAIEVYFVNQKPERIKTIRDVKGKMYPIRQADHAKLMLRGVKWEAERQPTSKKSLFKQ
ncbi:MAG: hypothetical protein EAY68_11170 [Bacteroidetes bacterium]|nr:MAG: hypothetical protein EAY68_11170 [Bacteroidota bacterium]